MITPDQNLTDEIHELRRANRALGARNAKLAELLKSSRDQLSRLNEQLDRLNEPPNTYGTFLECSDDGHSAEIFTQGRRMRVPLSPRTSLAELTPGVSIRLGDGHQILGPAGFREVGSIATIVDLLDTTRLIVTDPMGEKRVIRAAASLTMTQPRPPKIGDSVLFDPRSGYAFELLPKNEVAKLSLEEVPNVTYADIGGLDQQIEQIHDAVELPFAHPELYSAYQLKPPKGVLLYGPPGNGKTLIAKAVANSLATATGASGPSYFLNVKGPELLNKYVGETERQIRIIFERARELADDGRPVVIFFDEMESIFRTRGSGKSSDVETTVVPQLLTELDGVEALRNVIVIGATNREELIDPAILRPGRLDVKIRISRPSRRASKDIFARYLRADIPLARSTDELIEAAVTDLFTPRPYVQLTYNDETTEVLNYSDFISGAMIANIVDRAKQAAIKEQLASDCRRGGIDIPHLLAAIAAEQYESDNLPNTANPDEWTRITGKRGKRVIDVTVVGYGEKHDTVPGN